MHDPSAVIAITDPDLFGFEHTPITVICEGDEIGRTVPGGDGRPAVTVAKEVDSQAVRQRFLDTITAADDWAVARSANE